MVSRLRFLSAGGVLVAGLLGGVAPAAAGPDARLVLSRDGLAFAAAELPKHIPTSIPVAGVQREELADCGINKIKATVGNVGIDLIISSVNLVPEPNTLSLIIQGAVRATGQVKVENAACIGGTLSCTIRGQVNNMTVSASFMPTEVNGSVQLTTTSVNVGVNENNLDVKLDCGLTGSILNALFTFFRGLAAKEIRSQIETIVREQLKQQLESLLTNVNIVGGQSDGYAIGTSISGLNVDPTGLSIDAAVDVTTQKAATCAIDTNAPMPDVRTGNPSFSFHGEHLGLAISAKMMRDVIYAAWRAGELCISTPALQTGTLDAYAPNPPIVRLIEASKASIGVLMEGFQITLTTPAQTIAATMDVELTLVLSVGLNSSVVFTEPHVEIRNLVLNGPTADGDLFTADDLEQLLTKAMVPQIESAIEGGVVVPRVFGGGAGLLGGYFVYLARAQTTDAYIHLYASFFAKPVSDTVPPETQFAHKPTKGTRAETYEFLAVGQDDQTPTALLRYSWRVDGGEWTAPDYASKKGFVFADGEHTVDVVAVDLNDQRDPTPASVTFETDAVAPTIEITEAPPATISDGKMQLTFEVSDDRTPAEAITVDATLYRTTDIGDQEALRTDQLTDGARQLTMDQIQDGSYTIKLVAKDAVGNPSKAAQAEFVVEGAPVVTTGSADPGLVAGGCAVGPAADQSMAWLLVFAGVAMVLAGRSRRRHRGR